MQAQIGNRRHAKRGILPPLVIPQTDSSQPNTSNIPSLRGCSSEPLGTLLDPPNPPPNPPCSDFVVEVAGAASKSTTRTQPYKSHSPSKENSIGKEVAEGPSEPKKRERKHRNKGSCSSSSNKGSEARSKKRKAKKPTKKAEEAENLRLIPNGSEAFGHNFSLKCTYWQREKLSSDAKFIELHKKFEESETSRVVVDERVKQLEV
ncbi:hypothetical protein Salat_0199300 [Sesamum alatum]|uniref:Uncharacterized protein n=1 Tax=Sesamum alatum TaxID=300844 RepID=A0AAE2CXZ5_9LAMI|nr:hypothetical protein Salat_0199300 [Sesamum alatum]